jgi:hypothetical protein
MYASNCARVTSYPPACAIRWYDAMSDQCPYRFHSAVLYWPIRPTAV